MCVSVSVCMSCRANKFYVNDVPTLCGSLLLSNVSSMRVWRSLAWERADLTERGRLDKAALRYLTEEPSQWTKRTFSVAPDEWSYRKQVWLQIQSLLIIRCLLTYELPIHQGRYSSRGYKTTWPRYFSIYPKGWETRLICGLFFSTTSFYIQWSYFLNPKPRSVVL